MTLLDSPLVVLGGILLLLVGMWAMPWLVPAAALVSRHPKATLPLDGLRGLLAAAVFVHHGRIWLSILIGRPWAEPHSALYGNLGPAAVLSFFFISGYLFWRKALAKPESVQPRRLWPNRFLRIVPAYWVAVVAAFFAALTYTSFHRQVSWMALLVEALRWITGFLPGPGTTDINGVSQIWLTAGVMWTLRMESAFYLLLPLLARLRRPAGFAAMVLVAALLQRAAIHALQSPRSQLPGLLLGLVEQFAHMFLVGFVVGMLAASQPWPDRLRGILRTWPAAWLSSALLVFGLLLRVQHYSIVQSLTLAPAFFAVVEGNSFGGLLIWRPTRALGTISYSLYLLHGLVLFACCMPLRRYLSATAATDVLRLAALSVVALLVLVVSAVNYRLVESRFWQG